MHTRYHIALALSAAALLGGCSGSGTTQTGTETQAIEGKLIDAPVAGVTYRCGTIEGETGADGRFGCATLPVEFRVGGVVIGQMDHLPDDGVVTPQDLAGVSRDTIDANVTRLAQFFQSLDDDGIRDEMIRVDTRVREQLQELNRTVCEMDEPTLKEMLEEAGAHDIVSVEEAIAHLRAQMERLDLWEMTFGSPETNGTHGTHSDTHPENDHGATPPDGPHEHPNEHNQTADTPPADTHGEGNASAPEVPEQGESPDPETPQSPSEPDTHGSDEGDPEHGSGAQTHSEEKNPSDYEAYKAVALDAINAARAEGRTCGKYGYMSPAPAVSWNDHLYASSLEHSRDMALSNTFSHTGSGTESDATAKALHPGTGSRVAERIEHNGYGEWRRYGENIAAGTSMDEVEEAMAGWLKSPGHCKNIMNPKFEEVGMALYYHKKSHYRYYWTQDFATAKSR